MKRCVIKQDIKIATNDVNLTTLIDYTGVMLWLKTDVTHDYLHLKFPEKGFHAHYAIHFLIQSII